jgi:hypothetical protein
MTRKKPAVTAEEHSWWAESAVAMLSPDQLALVRQTVADALEAVPPFDPATQDPHGWGTLIDDLNNDSGASPPAP